MHLMYMLVSFLVCKAVKKNNMTHIRKSVYILVFLSTLIAALVLHKRTQADINSCKDDWCGERNAVFYDVSHYFSRKDMRFKMAATASHIINFGVVGVGVPLELAGMLLAQFGQSSATRAGHTFVVYLLSVGMVYAITLLFKSAIPRQRPAAFFNMTNETELGSKDPADEFESFFSGDASLSAHAATFFFLFSGGIKPCWRATGIFFFQCLAVSGIFLRVVALMHWPSDILTGSAVGTVVAGISYACFKDAVGMKEESGGGSMQVLISVGKDKSAGLF